MRRVLGQRPVPSLSIALFVTGFVSLLGQIVLLRELSVAFYGVELVYLLALGVWLLGSALGAAVLPRRATAGERGLGSLFVAFAGILPLAVIFVRGSRRIFGGTPGAYLPFTQGLLALALAVVPVAVLAGLLFVGTARAAVGGGSSFAEAYAVESVGGLAAGVAATVLLVLGARATVLALLCSLAALGAATPLWRHRARFARIWLAALATAALIGILCSARLDRSTARWNHPLLVETRDSAYARLAVTRSFEQVSLFANDALVFDSESAEQESFVHPVLLQHPAPGRVAILGGAAEGLVLEALKHGPASVDAVELDLVALELALRFLPREQGERLLVAPVRLVRADPRRFLASAPRYDAILVGMPDPDSGQTNRFYTREFFRECAERLGERGVIGLRLRSAENLWTPLLTRRMAAIHRALAAEFRDVLWLPGSVNVIVASQTPLTRDPDVLAGRLDERRIVCRLVSRPYLNYVMTNGRGAEIAARLAGTRVPANTDVRPVCYTYAAALWLSKFFPRLGFADMPWPDDPGWRGGLMLWVAFGLAAPLALLRRWSRARRAALAFVAGLSGMVAESVLILYYQAKRGALFQDLGLLLGAFMTGLALGAWILSRWAPAASGSGARRVVRGVLLLVLTTAFNLGLALETRAGLVTGRAGIGVALLVCGMLVGALLAHASQGPGDPGSLVSALYAADLLGGGVGALAGSLVALPLLGLVGTSLALAALACAALVLA